MKKVRFDLWLLRSDGSISIILASKKYQRLLREAGRRRVCDGDQFLVTPACPFAYCPVVYRTPETAQQPSDRAERRDAC